MTYVQGFLIPVPDAKRAAYHEMAAQAAPLFREFGATRIVETWGDDVPAGERTDMKRAVQAETTENVVFSWIEYPDRATCDAAGKTMESDERMQPPADMPFDGKRLIYAGFDMIMDEGRATPGYVDGFVAAVPSANRDTYLEHARTAAAIFRREGAGRVVETWGVDVKDGTHTDFRKAVAATPDETIVFSWIEWPDKPTRDAGMAAMMADPAMHAMEMPFDGKRMIFGGFAPLLDTHAA